jgi:hypothetical protein
LKKRNEHDISIVLFIKITKKRVTPTITLWSPTAIKATCGTPTHFSLGKIGEDGLDKLISAIGKHKEVLTAIQAA